LLGRSATGSTENCTKSTHEQTVFRADSTFATEHNGKALAVGFWKIDEDRLEMHILTTEASLPQLLQEELPGVLKRPQQRRELLRCGAGASAALLAAPLAGCDESPAAALQAWRGPAAN